ncbi:Dabb family protein [Nocardia halotolerans]|uniref:Dabb family protein n=1 Tax=Nocardia halotolerans TaxID=1755878 RepID=A0ABV8VK33_9NOCA
MFDVVALLHRSAGSDTDRLIGELRTDALASGAREVLVQPTLPGVRNGGDILVRLRFDDAAAWRASRWSWAAVTGRADIGHVDGVEYRDGVGGTAEPATGSVYRVLLLRVAPGTPTATIERFEADLLRMPHYISTIRSWRLSRVAGAVGSSPWTHVWEQEFSDLDGLNGPYLMHPVHWALVDRWFDPEHPDVIVRDRICHSFCVNEPLRG